MKILMVQMNVNGGKIMSDLDNEELEATRKLNVIDKENKIEVGDRITYIRKFIDEDRIITEIVTIDSSVSPEIDWFKEHLEKGDIKIIKIERPKYEVVEEKKELLTDAEKEFLKDVCKYYDVNNINFKDDYIVICNDTKLKNVLDYPANLKFENVERCKEYILKELGLEE